MGKQVFARFSNRDKPTTVTPIINQSVSYYAIAPDSNGILARHFFTEGGRVTNLVLEIGKWTGSGKLFIIRTNALEVQTTAVLNPHAGRTNLDDVSVKNGDKFYLKFQPDAEGDSIGEVWTAFKFSARG